MHTVRIRSIALCLLVCLLFLGGCVYNPWGQIPIIPMEPANLIENGDAENNGLGWNFSSFDATVHSASGNPAFAIRNDATLRHTVNIGNPLGAYVVVMAMSATETIGPTGMGMIWGDFIDAVDPQLVVGGLFSNQIPYLFEAGASPHQRLFIKGYVDGVETLSKKRENAGLVGLAQVSEGDLTKMGLNAAFKIAGSLWIDLLWERTVTGENVGAGSSMGFGLAYAYAKD